MLDRADLKRAQPNPGGGQPVDAGEERSAASKRLLRRVVNDATIGYAWCFLWRHEGGAGSWFLYRNRKSGHSASAEDRKRAGAKKVTLALDLPTRQMADADW